MAAGGIFCCTGFAIFVKRTVRARRRLRRQGFTRWNWNTIAYSLSRSFPIRNELWQDAEKQGTDSLSFPRAPGKYATVPWLSGPDRAKGAHLYLGKRSSSK